MQLRGKSGRVESSDIQLVEEERDGSSQAYVDAKKIFLSDLKKSPAYKTD